MKKLKRMSLTTRLSWTGFAFISPFVLGFLFFFLEPLLQSLRFVFSKVEVTLEGYNATWIGMENLRYIFREDATFSQNLVTSVTNLVWQVPIILVFSLFFAIILNQKFTGRTVVRAVFFLPVVIASGLILEIIQGDAAAGTALAGDVVATGGGSSQSDALQELLLSSGLNSEWINGIMTVANSLFDLTWMTGIQMIIFLAGLQSIPHPLYEAASIEGATAWESFWKITLPMLTPIIQLNLVYTIVDSFTDVGNKVMQQVMKNQQLVRYGWTSAMSWVYFLIIAVILVVVFVAFYLIERNTEKSHV